LKLTVDNLLNMKVEIDAKLLNMERNMSDTGGGSSAVAVNLISEVEDTKKQLFIMQKRLSAIDSMTKNFIKNMGEKGMDTARQMEMTKEIEELYAKMNELYGDMEKKALDMNRLAPMDVTNKVSNLNARISRLEEQLHSLPKSSGSRIYDEQMKELLEKIILLETRVNVLETHIVEPQKNQPIILE